MLGFLGQRRLIYMTTIKQTHFQEIKLERVNEKHHDLVIFTKESDSVLVEFEHIDDLIKALQDFKDSKE